MPVLPVEIDKFMELSESIPVLDVRSPQEYYHAHFPRAFSLPIFNDEERKIIGTAYKQVNRKTAVNHGLDFFSKRMLTVQKELDQRLGEHQPHNKYLVHCWRGGMRSGAMAWLLSLYGNTVYVLAGGYKSYRSWVLEQFRFPYNLKVLGGYTGSGKTEYLKELRLRGECSIDLEGLANHKGSAFGGLGEEKQPSQEMFENMLAMALYRCRKELPQKEIWLEDESRHIGSINIPQDLWQNMRCSELYFLDIPFEERLKYLVDEYGRFDKKLLEEDILKIQKRLGGAATKEALYLLSQGELMECFEILLKYYDKYYAHSLEKRQEVPAKVHKIRCELVSHENIDCLI